MREERKNRFLDTLPCLNQPLSTREVKLNIRALKISNEVEKKLVEIFCSQEFQQKLFKQCLWSISTMAMNFDLSKVWVSFTLSQDYASLEEAIATSVLSVKSHS